MISFVVAGSDTGVAARFQWWQQCGIVIRVDRVSVALRL